MRAYIGPRSERCQHPVGEILPTLRLTPDVGSNQRKSSQKIIEERSAKPPRFGHASLWTIAPASTRILHPNPAMAGTSQGAIGGKEKSPWVRDSSGGSGRPAAALQPHSWDEFTGLVLVGVRHLWRHLGAAGQWRGRGVRMPRSERGPGSPEPGH